MNEYTQNFLIISGIFASLLSFYNAFRVQKYRGIAAKSKLEAIYAFIFFVIQSLLSAHYFFEENEVTPLVLIILSVLIIMLYKIYANGKVIVIQNTSKQLVIERIRSELNRLSVPYTEEGFDFSDLHQFKLEDQTVIKVSSPWGGEKEFKTYHLSFIKWWRLDHYEEIKTNITEKYRDEREEVVFWKQILTSVGTGFIALIFIGFLNWKWSTF